MSALHRRAAALLGLIALLAFIAGAGTSAPTAVPAALVLLVALVVQPGATVAARLEPLWRGAALLLAARAAWHVVGRQGDPVLPMVDLLLLLLCAESLRARDGSGDARHFALTFALLIAAAAYRPGPLFGLLFVAYVFCGSVVLLAGHVTREARARGLAVPRRAAAAVPRIATLSGAIVLASLFVFLLFPRATRGFSPRSGSLATAVAGFSDRVSIGNHGARIEANSEIVMRIEFPGGPPAHLARLRWRGRAYDQFDGTTWSRSPAPPEPGSAYRDPADPVIEQVIHGRRLSDASVLFGLHPILEIEPRSAIRVQRVAQDDYVFRGDVDPVYAVRSRAHRPLPETLRSARVQDLPLGLDPRVGGSAEALRNLQLPPLPRRVLALADSFRSASPSAYDQAAAIEQWLRSEFGYTLDLPQTRREARLDHFLFERRAGHCEYFSTAMAVLLRAGGVPARNVNGFLGGEWNEYGRFLAVTQNHAHSWVEVFFPGVGWVEFDPTPATGPPPAAEDWLSAARRYAAGLQHQWGRWVLDYDRAQQQTLLQRLARPWRTTDAADERPSRRHAVAVLVLVLAAAVASIIRLRRVHASGGVAEVRQYRALRRAYTRLGLPPADALPPLAFARAVADEAGGADAARAVQLYIRARFAGVTLSADERAALRDCARAARRAVARSRYPSASGSREVGNAGR